ncbi:MAG: hypothetical protein WC854_13890 [Bacteroidales bacterium]
MKTYTFIIYSILLALLSHGCKQDAKETSVVQADSSLVKKLIAKTYNSGFPMAHDTYNGISVASDGKIYYVLCTQSLDVAGQMYSYDPKSGKIQHLGDLTEACGEKGLNAVAQGKSHVNFIESKGKLYFATHIGYYGTEDGIVTIGTPPPGYKPYQGGHILAYDLKSEKFEDLGIELHREGILSMNMDTLRGVIYGLSWPSGYFFRYDLAKKEMKDIGPISGKGQRGKGAEFRTLCRTIAINPEDGTAYVTTSEGTILQCRYGQDKVEPVEGENLKKDYFGLYDPSQPGNMGYNWRNILWNPNENVFYGVHGNSGYLFRFDPKNSMVEVLERITSEPSKRSGMFDQFSFGYLGFILGPDGRTLYYLTGAPAYVNGKRVVGKSTTNTGEAKALENLHLITYDIPSAKYTDHGPVFYTNGQPPLYVNSIAIGADGTIYSLARIPENGKTRTDLISIPNPIKD